MCEHGDVHGDVCGDVCMLMCVVMCMGMCMAMCVVTVFPSDSSVVALIAFQSGRYAYQEPLANRFSHPVGEGLIVPFMIPDA